MRVVSAKTAERRRHVSAYAQQAVIYSQWRSSGYLPYYVRVDVELYNISLDRDNAVKELYDTLQGYFYCTDRSILDGFIKRRIDKQGPRIVVTITEVNGLDYGFKKPPPSEKHRYAV